MRAWLLSKMASLSESFLAGEGHPSVFESQYLVYLECFVAASDGPVEDFWREFSNYSGGQALSNREVDRETLVASLRVFRQRYEGPSPHHFMTPKEGNVFAEMLENVGD